jgi:hypothetical protein
MKAWARDRRRIGHGIRVRTFPARVVAPLTRPPSPIGQTAGRQTQDGSHRSHGTGEFRHVVPAGYQRLAVPRLAWHRPCG